MTLEFGWLKKQMDYDEQAIRVHDQCRGWPNSATLTTEQLKAIADVGLYTIANKLLSREWEA